LSHRYEDLDLERNGLIRLDQLPWTDDLRWLRATLSCLVRGKFRYTQFTHEWWKDTVTVAATL